MVPLPAELNIKGSLENERVHLRLGPSGRAPSQYLKSFQLLSFCRGSATLGVS